MGMPLVIKIWKYKKFSILERSGSHSKGIDVRYNFVNFSHFYYKNVIVLRTP